MDVERSMLTKCRFWKGCKPSSVCLACARERIICLSSQYPRPAAVACRLERAAPWSPIWPCSGWGFPCLVNYSSSGGLLPHLFTLTASRAGGGLFSVALSVNPVFLRDRPRVSSAERPLARTMLGYAASRPLEFGL